LTIKKKIKRKAITSRKKIRLRAANARITQNLGNGFRRFVFTRREIAPGAMLELSLVAGANRKAISGGWSLRPGDPKTPDVISTESYPRSDNEWVITIWNESTDFHFVIPYLIDKRG
jgi:hypothetical protein